MLVLIEGQWLFQFAMKTSGWDAMIFRWGCLNKKYREFFNLNFVAIIGACNWFKMWTLKPWKLWRIFYCYPLAKSPWHYVIRTLCVLQLPGPPGPPGPMVRAVYSPSFLCGFFSVPSYFVVLIYILKYSLRPCFRLKKYQYLILK